MPEGTGATEFWGLPLWLEHESNHSRRFEVVDVERGRWVRMRAHPTQPRWLALWIPKLRARFWFRPGLFYIYGLAEAARLGWLGSRGGHLG